MRAVKFFFGVMLVAVSLFAAPGDTLFVLRVTPADSTGVARQVRDVFLPGFSISPGAFGKINIAIPRRLIWNDSTAVYDTVSTILKGVDTVTQEIIHTTEDTLPAGGLEGLRLDDAGLFLQDD